MQLLSIDYSFLRSEWFWCACMMVYTAWAGSKNSKESVKQEKLQVKEKNIENNLRLKAEFRQNWAKIANLSGEGKILYAKDISEIPEDDVKVLIFQVIDILQDVFYFYKERGQNPLNSLWKNTYLYVFNPVRMKAFVSAYKKYKDEQDFDEDFKKFVDKIIINQKRAIKHKKGREA